MKHRNRTLGTLVGAVVALAVTLQGAPAAFAATDPAVELSADDLAYMHEVADRFGVSDEVLARLIAKVEAGIPLDSSTGAYPVAVTSSEVDGFARTVETFADGSFIGSDVEIAKPAPEGVNARGVSSCVYSSSAGVSYGQDCWVYTSGVTAGASFYTSYSVWSGGSSVWNWHSPSINIVGGSLTHSEFSQPSGNTIQLRFNYQTGPVLTQGAWIQAAVVGTGLSQTRGGAW